MLTMEFFFTLFMTTLPVFAYSHYDQNARIAGVFYVAMGAGALLGMPVVSGVVRRFGALHVAAGALVLASVPKLLLGFALPAAGVAAVLVLQGIFGPLTGAPIFTVITTRTPAALRNLVLPAAFGLMFLPGASRPDCRRSTHQRGRGNNGLRHRRDRMPVGSAPFAIYVARHRNLDGAASATAEVA